MEVSFSMSNGTAQMLWGGLIVALVVCLSIDFWAHRRAREVTFADAALWTAAWVGVALAGAAVVWAALGADAFAQFVSGYTVEWSLSMDNVLVFVGLMATLMVPRELRYRVLFFGTIGSIVLRMSFIAAGSALLARVGWLTFVFGAFLLVIALRTAMEAAGDRHEQSPTRVHGFLRCCLRISHTYDGDRLTTIVDGRRMATPLLVALLLVTITDVLFATDSIPAVFAMTRDTFVACSSNAAAVLGLRSLYFVLQGVVDRLRYLKPALALLLVLVGGKMLAAPVLEVPPVLSLLVVLAIPLGAAVLSLVWPQPPSLAPAPAVEHPAEPQ